MNPVRPPDPGPSLARELSLWDAVAIVVGCIIGAGIFRVPASVANQLGDPAAVLVTWVFGGLLSITGALTYAELASLMPKTGGDYVFLREAYGPAVGFLFGWTKLFVERTGTLAIIAFVFAEYLCYLLAFPKEMTKFAAIGAIGLLTLANIVGLKYGKWIQNVFTFLKVLALALIILLGFAFLPHHLAQGKVGSFLPRGGWSLDLIPQAGMALIFILWTYGGWTEAAYVAEEIRDSERNVGRAIVGGVSLVILLYLLVNVVYALYIPLPEMRQTNLVASAVMEKILGGWGGRMVALFVAVSTFGALNGYILTGGRILLALASDHALFHRFSAIHSRFRTPAVALVFNAVCAMILVLTKTLDQLMEYTTIVISIFFAMAGISLFVFRKRFPDRNRPYRVIGYPWTPLIFVASTLLFVGNAVFREPKESLFGILLVAIGYVFYLISRKLKSGAAVIAADRT